MRDVQLAENHIAPDKIRDPAKESGRRSTCRAQRTVVFRFCPGHVPRERAHFVFATIEIYDGDNVGSLDVGALPAF